MAALALAVSMVTLGGCAGERPRGGSAEDAAAGGSSGGRDAPIARDGRPGGGPGSSGGAGGSPGIGGGGGAGGGADGTAGTGGAGGRGGAGGTSAGGAGGGTGGAGGAAGAAGSGGRGDASAPADGASPVDARPGDTAPRPDAARADASPVDASPADAAAPGGFNPCPPLPARCRVMPLGDSITKGEDDVTAQDALRVGYRLPLFRMLTDAGKQFDFVGTLVNGPAELASKNHEGHSGWTTRELIEGRGRLADPPGNDSGNLDRWLAANPADVFLFMLGANDVIRGLDVPTSRHFYEQIFTRIFAARPDALLVVGTMLPMRSQAAAAVDERNAALAALVRTHAAAGKHVVLVDTHAALGVADLASGGVHPNATGYAKLAGAWFSALRGVLRGP